MLLLQTIITNYYKKPYAKSIIKKKLSTAYGEGGITKEEYDILVEQSKELAEARLQELPGDVKRIVDSNLEKLQEGGKGFLLSLTDILLMIALGGGAGASGLAGIQRRQSK